MSVRQQFLIAYQILRVKQMHLLSVQQIKYRRCSVPDPRLYELEKHQITNKIIHTTVEIVDIPGLAKGSNKERGWVISFLVI